MNFILTSKWKFNEWEDEVCEVFALRCAMAFRELEASSQNRGWHVRRTCFVRKGKARGVGE